jgi:hypothetical protein
MQSLENPLSSSDVKNNTAKPTATKKKRISQISDRSNVMKKNSKYRTHTPGHDLSSVFEVISWLTFPPRPRPIFLGCDIPALHTSRTISLGYLAPPQKKNTPGVSQRGRQR